MNSWPQKAIANCDGCNYSHSEKCPLNGKLVQFDRYHNDEYSSTIQRQVAYSTVYPPYGWCILRRKNLIPLSTFAKELYE
jgi:hypothetical protein